MKSHLCVISFICFVKCEWVEITPIQNKKYLSAFKNLDITTTVNYESIMKNPFINTETTTPSYLLDEQNYSHNDKDVIEERVITEIPASNNNSTEFSDDYQDFERKESSTIEDFLPFLKTVQKNLMKYKNTHKSKMSVLKHLRDHILRNIKELITNIWKPKFSEARGYYEDDTHMDFPSNEGALMTIGFLTFAVFLIKLVIKLIHALKHKQQYYQMTSTTTAASVVFLKRRKRDEQQEEMNKILQYIEEF